MGRRHATALTALAFAAGLRLFGPAGPQPARAAAAEPCMLRLGRAIHLLELLGSAESIALLRCLARAAPYQRSRREAAASLRRLMGSPICPPADRAGWRP